MIDDSVKALCSSTTLTLLELLDNQYLINVISVERETLAKYGDGNGVIRGTYEYLDFGAHMIKVADIGSSSEEEENEPTEYIILHELVHLFQQVITSEELNVEEDIKNVFFPIVYMQPPQHIHSSDIYYWE